MFARELNEYWKTIVDTIQEGVIIVDPEGTIVAVNRAFEAMTGYRSDEIIGQPCSVLNCTSCEIARTGHGCHWCLLFRQGTLKQQRCVLLRRDGAPLHVLKNASVFRDGKGEVIGAVETLTDISALLERDSKIEAFRRELSRKDTFYGMIGQSAPMQRVFDLITNAAASDAPVIVYGESGTGKELIARAIHQAGDRRERPYVKVNCAALNPALLESELFGHVKGAFTGAYQDREGRFEAAHTGSIFLDEIGEMALSTQVKLLRVLEERVIERVGDNQPVHVDVRIISATNRDLWRLVQEGRFREDFFYRINVIPIHVPPLRERPGDIPLLAESFFHLLKLRTGRRLEGISREAMQLLLEYPWPGNVRELRSAFEYAFVTCRQGWIRPEDFPPALLGHAGRRGGTPPPPALPTAEDRRQRQRRELVAALEQTRGNQTKAAAILGVSRATVWNRLKRFGIDPAEFKRPKHPGPPA